MSYNDIALREAGMKSELEAGKLKTLALDPRLWMSALLVVIGVAAYLPLFRCDFVMYDDQAFVTQNTIVQQGLTLKGVETAFTTLPFHLYMPVTLLSHMLDCQLFGLNPMGHHLMNLLYHLINVLLLFMLLVRMTRASWRSWTVAALFAIHPMHVEAVAWISERKELLSALFGFLAIWMYLNYVRKPRQRTTWLVFLFMLLALLCKPMLVTLPFLLILLDIWPLRRFKPFEGSEFALPQPGTENRGRHDECFWGGLRFRKGWFEELKPLLREKLPILFLSLTFSIGSFLTNKLGGSLDSLKVVSLSERFGNALYAYGQYLVKLFFPVGMTVFYPHPLGGLSWWLMVAGALLLALVTLYFLRWAVIKPYLIVGWLWFLGMLVPVIGLIQVGSLQSYADRYSYFTYTGLFILLVWGGADLALKCSRRKRTLGAVGLIFLFILLGLQNFQQTLTWRDTETLFTHSLAVEPKGNYVANAELGMVMFQRRTDIEGAKVLLKKAIVEQPGIFSAWANLGSILVEQEKYRQAVACLRMASRTGGERDFGIQSLLARSYMEQKKYVKALAYCRRANRISPDHFLIAVFRANSLMGLGRLRAAERVVRESLKIHEDNEWLLADMSAVLAGEGHGEEATRYADAAVKAGKEAPRIYYELARTYLEVSKVNPEILARASIMAQRAVDLSEGRVARYELMLGDVNEAAGQRKKAEVHWRKALSLYRRSKNEDLVKSLEERLEQRDSTGQGLGATHRQVPRQHT